MHAREPMKNDKQPQRPARSAAARPGGRVPDALLDLQRTAGNAAVARMLQQARHQG